VPIIQGLAAFLLGLCFEYNNDSVAGMTRAAIQSIVISRIGSDQFVQRLNFLKDHLVMLRTTGAAASSLPLFDEMFVDLCIGKGLIDVIIKNVVNPQALKMKQQEKEEQHQQETVLTQYKQLIASQDSELAQLRKQIQEMKVSGSGLVNGASGDNKALESARKEVNEWAEKYAHLQKEMEDLLVCLAEQDEEVKRLKSRLRELGEPISEDEEDEEGGSEDHEQ
jgi:hypothetical protein